MRRSPRIFYFLLLEAVFSPAFPQALEGLEVCDFYFGNKEYEGQYTQYEWQYSHLFSKLEEALIDNKTVLNVVRQIFLNTDYTMIGFSIQLEVINGTGLVHICDLKDGTFCPTNITDYRPKWKLCDHPNGHGALSMMFSSQNILEEERQMERMMRREREKENSRENKIDVMIAWLSMLHGSLPATFPSILPRDKYNYLIPPGIVLDNTNSTSMVSMTLVIQQLDCNPSITMLQCVMSDILRWVSK